MNRLKLKWIGLTALTIWVIVWAANNPNPGAARVTVMLLWLLTAMNWFFAGALIWLKETGNQKAIDAFAKQNLIMPPAWLMMLVDVSIASLLMWYGWTITAVVWITQILGDVISVEMIKDIAAKATPENKDEQTEP